MFIARETDPNLYGKADAKTETKYELIPVEPMSDAYAFEGEIHIDGKIFGRAYRAKENRVMPWSVIIFPSNWLDLGGAGVGKTLFDAVLDAFGSCVRIIEQEMRDLNEFSAEHKTGLAGITVVE